MPYKSTNPTYNVDRKVVNFKDFATDKEKLSKAELQRKPNSEQQQHIGNKRTEYNPVTHKLTDYSDDEIKDKLDSIEELEGTNEEFGGAPGVCNISIEGEGLVKTYAIQAVQKALRNIGGEVNLTVDGKEIDSRGYDDRPIGI